MKKKEVRKLKGEELDKKMGELTTELIKLKGQSETGTPPKSPGQIKQIKRTIAQMKTMQRQKEIESMIQKKEEKQVNARN